MLTELSPGITVDPKVMAGKPVIKGTDIPVDLILSKLSTSHNLDDLLADYPELNLDQVKDCLRYAASLLQGRKKKRSIIPW